MPVLEHQALPTSCQPKQLCHCSCYRRLRWVKSAAEISLMRMSASIAAHAQRRCMQLSQAGVHERVLATEFEYSVKLAGASRLAYPTMAGGGSDTCTIHYGRNDKRVSVQRARQQEPVCVSTCGCEHCGLADKCIVSPVARHVCSWLIYST
mgnify:CR=1 FL=1